MAVPPRRHERARRLERQVRGGACALEVPRRTSHAQAARELGFFEVGVDHNDFHTLSGELFRQAEHAGGAAVARAAAGDCDELRALGDHVIRERLPIAGDALQQRIARLRPGESIHFQQRPERAACGERDARRLFLKDGQRPLGSRIRHRAYDRGARAHLAYHRRSAG